MKLYYESELYHHGVKGMKWGKRKAQARADYKHARRKALDDFYKKVDPLEENYEWGHKDGHGGLSKEARAGINKADKEYKSAVNKAKADYKQAKANIKADKKEFKSDVKALNKNRGSLLATPNKDGSVNIQSMSELIKDGIKTRKGKEYLDQVVKKANRQQKVRAISAATIAIGSAALGMYLSGKYSGIMD